MTTIEPVLTRSRELAAFGASITADALPEPVVHNARRAFVDWTAAALAGSGEPAAAKLRGVVAAVGGDGPCTVVGTTLRTSPPFAALANAYTSHLLDYDDVYNPSATTIHLGSCVWPAVLAIGQARGLAGPALVAAYVAGFEVGARVACAAGPQHYESGWHVTGTAGHLAAAAAAANALGLSAEATTHALGCAATQAAGVREVYGSDTKAIHPGKAAMDGVLAALLAENGFTSTDTALEGERGLLRAITPRPHPELLTEGLGTDGSDTHWHVLDNGHKLYPSASLTHPAIDAVLALDPVDPAEVAAIEVRMAGFAAAVTALAQPETGAAAKFSTAHCVAAALTRRHAGPAEFTDTVVADPVVAALRDKVTVLADEAVTKRGCLLRITLHDRTELRSTVEQNKGTPAAPLTDADLEDKLVTAGDATLGHQTTDLLVKSCWALDRLAGLDELMAYVTPVSPVCHAG
ncbi:MmgE/PrpD family protein [Amycolatopsis sp. NPDC050768]|uniref:MmgE/PrpD family protein n=1 Tax=Amycolatopsis sp. NPDC050768 TaxID=3154839 RepID=UPI0033DC35D0